ncbi:MAG: hypothetical protein AB1941_01705 [Gemmatimonadota bacterium]
MNKADILNRITEAFDRYLNAAGGGNPASLVPDTVKDGKLYEAHVLSQVARELVTKERYTLRLVQSDRLILKSSPGPINPTYPHIEVWDKHKHVASLWTDVEFTALSCSRSGRYPCRPGHYHELDILLVDADATGRPTPEQVWLGIECKNTVYEKALLRQILGVRRELSLLASPTETHFRKWPRREVPANPPSCLIVYASNPAVLKFADPGRTFGIDFVYDPLV